MKERKKQNIVFGCLISLALFAILIVVLAFIEVTPYERYNNQSHRFTLKYPAFWGIDDQLPLPEALVQFYAPRSSEMDNVTENVNISYFNLDRKRYKNLYSFSKVTMEQLIGTFGEYLTVLDNKQIRFGGQPGHQFSYITRSETGITQNASQMKYLHVWTIKDDRAYILTYVGDKKDFDDNLKYVNAMVKSFKFLK